MGRGWGFPSIPFSSILFLSPFSSPHPRLTSVNFHKHIRNTVITLYVTTISSFIDITRATRLHYRYHETYAFR